MKTSYLWGCVALLGMLSGCAMDTTPEGMEFDDMQLDEASSVPPVGPVIPCAACNGMLDVGTGYIGYTIPNSVLIAPTKGDVRVESSADGFTYTYTATLLPGFGNISIPASNEPRSSAMVTFTGADGNRYSFSLVIVSSEMDN